MPRSTAGELPPNPPLSPYQTPPMGVVAPIGAPPLNYAGQPIPPAPAAKATPTPSGLFNAFKRRWVMGTFVALMVATSMGVGIWMFLPAGNHEVRALIDLRDKTNEAFSKNPEDYESYRRNQIYILKTRDLLNRTINDAAVKGLPIIKDADEPVRMIEESLVISSPGSTIVAVTMKGDDMEQMKIIIDALVKRYVDEATLTERKERDNQKKKLERMEESLKAEVESLERQMKLMARGSGATGGESGDSGVQLFRLRVNELSRTISMSSDLINRLEAELAVFKQQLETRKPKIDSAVLDSAVNNDPRIVKLREARDLVKDQYEREKKVATDPNDFPGSKELQAKIEKAEQALDAKKKEIAGDHEVRVATNALANLQEKVTGLETQIAVEKRIRDQNKADRDALEKTIGNSAESHVEIAAMLKGVLPQREAILKIQMQHMQLRLASELDTGAKIREAAQFLPNNNKKKKLVLSIVAALGSFTIVVLLVAYLEWRTRRVDGVDQVMNELGMRIIGTVPAFPNRASLKAATEAGGSNWQFALNESINSTRTMLLHTARNRSMQVVMVTSATQGEGKTSLASQLATSMATAGMRALIVDCDLRNPSIHKLFDLGMSPGVSEVLIQEADPTEAIQPTTVPNLWVLPAGQCSNRVIAALAQGHALETMFNRLRGQYDFVIVDSCPVLPVADALLIGQHVDGVLFSIMQDISQLPKVLVATEKLGQLNIPLLGAVVNGIKQEVYSYGYNYAKQLPA